MKNSYTVVDIFAGCGGLSRGFMDAGYSVLLGVDNNDHALKTFKENHGDSFALNLNMFEDESVDIIVDFLKDKKVDVLVGGPPCQGFSLAGPRNENDERNKLYKSMVKVAKHVKPKVVVLENVPGLARLYNGKAKKQIIKDFKDLGYTMAEPEQLYAPDYGIPQIRKRIFFVGILEGDKEFIYPKPTHTKEQYVTCEQAIGDLPSRDGEIGISPCEYESKPLTEYQVLMRKNAKQLNNHLGTKHMDKVIKKLKLVPEGGNFRDLPLAMQEGIKYNEALTRYHSQKPSRTIDTGHRTHFHYKYDRVPSVRENARLQSFPDDFIFFGPKQEQYRQVGNAVPPLWGYHLGKQIMKYLNGDM